MKNPNLDLNFAMRGPGIKPIEAPPNGLTVPQLHNVFLSFFSTLVCESYKTSAWFGRGQAGSGAPPRIHTTFRRSLFRYSRPLTY